jgi:hypothetical protein
VSRAILADGERSLHYSPGSLLNVPSTAVVLTRSDRFLTNEMTRKCHLYLIVSHANVTVTAFNLTAWGALLNFSVITNMH